MWPVIYDNIVYDSLECLKQYKGFKIVNHNIRSLLPKINQIRLETDALGIEIYSFCETWLRPEIDSKLLEIPGYNLSRHDRIHRPGATATRGGGVCLYIADDIQYRVIPAHCQCNADIEIQVVEILHVSCRKHRLANARVPLMYFRVYSRVLPTLLAVWIL